MTNTYKIYHVFKVSMVERIGKSLNPLIMHVATNKAVYKVQKVKMVTLDRVSIEKALNIKAFNFKKSPFKVNYKVVHFDSKYMVIEITKTI